MKIIADSSCFISPSEGEKMGVKILPVGVIVNGQSYRDYIEISSNEILEKIQNGAIPTTSQPNVGEVVELYEEFKDEEILVMTIGDGLSGTYQSAFTAKTMVDNQKIDIFNTKTLAGAHNYLVKKAAELRSLGYTIEEIKNGLQESVEKSFSFVIPSDFQFLKRCGRLTPLAANVAGLIKIVPVLTLSEDRKKIEIFSINRTAKKALDSIIKALIEKGVDSNYIVNVCHAGVYEKACDVVETIKTKIQNIQCEILEISPSLMLHGGPGCILVQAVKK